MKLSLLTSFAANLVVVFLRRMLFCVLAFQGVFLCHFQSEWQLVLNGLPGFADCIGDVLQCGDLDHPMSKGLQLSCSLNKVLFAVIAVVPPLSMLVLDVSCALPLCLNTQ